MSEISLKKVWNLPFQSFLNTKFSSLAKHDDRYFWRLWTAFQKFSLCLADSIYPQIYNRTPCPVMLICKGVIKNKGGVGLFQISQKERLFHLLWQPSAFGVNLTMWSPFLHPSKKAFLSPSVWPRREYTWTLNWKESLLIYFENDQNLSYSHE